MGEMVSESVEAVLTMGEMVSTKIRAFPPFQIAVPSFLLLREPRKTYENQVA